jgi:predicted esterase
MTKHNFGDRNLSYIGAVSAGVMLALMVAGCVAWAADSNCTAFGDPPAQIQNGIVSGFIARHSPSCFRGETLGPWRDSDGTERYACLYEPAPATSGPLPLVVFLHGSLANADSVLATGLVPKSKNANLGAGAPGFYLLAPEGRETSHYYAAPDDKGLGWDNWYRQLTPAGDVTFRRVTYQENVDAAAIDHFIDVVSSSRKVDENRIYVTGWSNGAAMALLYALNRPRIAAAVVYSAPDPFSAFDDACPQTPVNHPPAGIGELELFNPHVPIMHVRNSCDIGGICPNGLRFVAQLQAVGNHVDDVIVDSDGRQVSNCDSTCGTNQNGAGEVSTSGSLRGFKNHVAWPTAWNDAMLKFMREHPRGASPAPAN